MNHDILKRLAMLLIIASGAPSFYCVAQRPIINSVDKKIAQNQETVTILGSNFGTTPAELSVFFGSMKGEVSFVSDQLLEVKVPSGTTYEKIAITNTASGLTGYTQENFLLSFGGEHGNLAAKLEGQVDFSAGSGLYDLCLCDFDSDGKTDVATANNNNTSLTLLANITTGSGLTNIAFNVTSLPLGAPSIHITCGDLNGDGKPDITVAEGGSAGGRVFVLKNTSTGIGNFSFASQSVVLNGKRVKQIKIADLDLDGKPEVIVTNQSGNNVTILVNESSASAISFSPTPITQVISGAASTDGLTVEDLNEDGFPDIMLSQFLTAASNIFVIPNSSTEGTVQMGTATSLSISGTVVNLQTGDLDGDEKPDLIATQLSGKSISIFLNESAGSTIAFSTPQQLPTNDVPWGFDLGDLDGDGKTDIAVASLTTKSLTFFNNESAPGNLSFVTTVKNTTFVNRHLRIGDVDGDAKPDVLFTSVDDNNNGIPASKVSVFRNTVCLLPEIGPPGPHIICSGFPLKLTSNESASTSYEWKNNTTTVASGADAFLDVSASGSYTVTATSEGGSCSHTSNAISVTVEPGTTTGPAIPANNGPICVGSTMNLSVNDVGGTEYQWTGPEGYTGNGLTPSSIPDFQFAHAGRYSLDVIVNNCLAQQVSTVVEAIPVPEFSISGGSGVVCPPDTKVLSISPNLSGFTYKWFRSDIGMLSGETSATLNVSAAGDYHAEATYTANPACATVETDVVTIDFATTPVADFNLPATACIGQNVTFSNASTTDPSATTDYNWTFGDGEASTEINPVHQYAAALTFNVTLTLSYGGACTSSATKSLVVQTAPPLTISNPDNSFSLCAGDSLQLEVFGTFNSIEWSTGEVTSLILVKNPGLYEVEATTSSGCVINASREVMGLEAPVVTITADPAEVPEGQTSQLSASGLNDYLWEPAETLSDASVANPIASPLQSTVYTVRGSGDNGCMGENSIEIAVREGSIYEKLIPSKFFSPGNGDDIGSYWLIERIEDFPGCEVSIYDIKGIKVYDAKPYLNDWDGTYNGKNLPDGVYYFMIKCEGEQDSPKTGSITLLR